MREQDYLVALNMVGGLGTIRTMRLVKHFSQAAQIFKTSLNELTKIDGISLSLAHKIASIINAKELKEELNLIDKKKIKIITFLDNAYPEYLKQIYDPPLLLYVQGDVACLNLICIALVGCRRASFYGQQQAERIAGGLAVHKICVVSGFARGIDTAAHRGAMAHGGKTVALLGSGLNHIYPVENKKIFDQIVNQGAVISEFPLSTTPQRWNFPRRNRIISGLSRAVVVVEAAKRSGSLITANLALEQGRDVYAVPGAANSVNAQGTNKLIKEGAKLVESAEDILLELNLLSTKTEKSTNNERREQALAFQAQLDRHEQRILEFLNSQPVHIDVLVRLCGLDQVCVYRNLLSLQLKGLVKEIEGKQFIRKGV